MKKCYLVFLMMLVVMPGCKKDQSKLSGTETINNTLYGSGPYYAYGFSFSLGKQLSTQGTPVPDMTLIVDADINNNIRRIMLQSENFMNSFYKFGEYATAEQAQQAYAGLTTANVTQWAGLADTVRANQVWLFRTESEHYAKFRIISTVAELRNNIAYGECTFDWAYQPDGTLTFPGK